MCHFKEQKEPNLRTSRRVEDSNTSLPGRKITLIILSRLIVGTDRGIPWKMEHHATLRCEQAEIEGCARACSPLPSSKKSVMVEEVQRLQGLEASMEVSTDDISLLSALAPKRSSQNLESSWDRPSRWPGRRVEGERHRDAHRERERDRDGERHRDAEREMGIERDIEMQTEREMRMERHRHSDRDRDAERQRWG